jgi:tetratricopeptide (TPR) repeat protein
MATPGRNDPCPCGSGTKYKKCCLLRTPPPPPASPPKAASPAWVLQDDGLDDLSNSVVDLVQARRFEEALGACQRLLQEFPDVVDGLERSALVHAALGDHATAADFYRKALAFVTDPSRCHEYEDADFYRQQVEKEERFARLR